MTCVCYRYTLETSVMGLVSSVFVASQLVLRDSSLFAWVVYVKPQEILIDGIKLRILAKPQPVGLRAAGKVDDGALIGPLLGFRMTVHKAERAGIAVEYAQRIPE